MASRFEETTPVQMSEIGMLREMFSRDPHESKVDLIVGAYRDDGGLPWVPRAVRLAELSLQEEGPRDHEYTPSLGDKAYRRQAAHLVLGPDSPALLEGRVVCVQTLGGTGSLFVGAKYLSQILKYNTVYFSSPTWNNHWPVFAGSGFKRARNYRYWSESKLAVDFQGMLEDLRRAPEDSVVVLQACAHNPTGRDLTQEQWRRVADLVQERKLVPFFDCAYQGFASGDLDRDAWAVRHFVGRGIELLCAQSFSKNMGLYDARLGCLLVVSKDSASCADISSHLEQIERAVYLTPPRHGSRIALELLNNNELYAQWKLDIATMATRVKQVRKELRRCLEDLGTPGSWSHITEQIGMFSYTGLSPEKVKHMIEKYHIYMLSCGRINMCGITSHTVRYVAAAIHEAVLLGSPSATQQNGVSATTTTQNTTPTSSIHMNGKSANRTLTASLSEDGRTELRRT